MQKTEIARCNFFNKTAFPSGRGIRYTKTVRAFFKGI